MRRLLLGLLLFACALSASAALRVDITKGLTHGIPIAVVPFSYQGASSPSVDVAQVVEDDLNRSGLFDPLARNLMLATPASADTVNYKNWREVSVNNVVVGKLVQTGNSIKLTFQLLDVYGGRQMAGYTITDNADHLRAMAHRVSDLVYKALTGQRGAFETRIAYISEDHSDKRYPYRLMVADYDGHNPRTVTRSQEPIVSPRWSPDGSRLAFVTFDHARTVVYVQNLRTGQVQKVSARAGLNTAPAWSPDGGTLALSLSFHGNPDIYLMNIDSGKLQQLTDSPAIDTEPAWSPDGKTIAFTSDRGGRPQLYLKSRSGGSAQRLTFEGQSNADPVFSPDGKAIAMVRQGNNGYRIAVMNLQSHQSSVVSKGPLDETPSYSPAGGMIIYDVNVPKGKRLKIVSADGRTVSGVETPGDSREPDWSPFTAGQGQGG